MITLLEQFDTIFDTPESVQKLQEFILDMAVKGKLVPQNSSNEPASALLERVKVEREKLIKEKRIRKGNEFPKITEEEKPYILPKGWKWVRLGELGNIFNGNSINAKIKEARYSKVTQGYGFIATKDIDSQTREIKYENGVKIPFHEEKFKVAHEGSVLICAEGGSAGKKIGILDRDVCFGNKLFAIQTYAEMNSEYIYFLYQSPLFYRSFCSRMTGIIGGISIGKFKEIPVPVPPVLEQKHIVEKIYQLMSFCRKLKEQLEKKQRREDRLNISAFLLLEQSETEKELKENFQFVLSHLHSLCTDTKHVQKLRNAILSLAVKGKLVPQDDNDEPASIFLEKVKQEKEELIKQKKIKKEKPFPQITDEEKPFNLPNRWEWGRLGEICNVITDGDHQPPPQTTDGINFLVISNVSKGTLSFENTRFVPKEYYDRLSELRKPKKGDILFTVTGSYGIPIIVDTDREFCFQRHIALLKPSLNIMMKYLYWVLTSDLVKKQCDEGATGTAQKTVSLTTLRNLKFPIPPLNEQKRIVEKLNQLMSLCNELEKNIEQSKQESERLMKAVLQEAFTVKEEVLN
ncbi:restriction endonuclease subunit S [Bacillus sp. 16GRE42]|uniref:restriction endonuclease subunit S n=1 Tax=Bacillus sp. 16GRE42 TaxID=2778092 RepID=UPI001C9AA2E5|nr:restriction endonuclease subunit S [Bacillus sp. 16GRE42]MBY7125750.1 restriction endonuclease subunit S [Bacillus sp. 16GRE42]